MHTLIFYEPGHFHAGLTLRISNPRVSPEIHLYAAASPERDAFLALVDSFNARAENPTGWRVVVHNGASSEALLDQLVRERPGDAVVLAGKNDRKLATIAALHDAGLHVLADKPWAVNAGALGALERATAPGPLALDIMTNRFDTLARLRHELAADTDVFGEFRAGEAPAIEIASIHHLVKVVNGETLRRPPWYYDVRVQGDGLVDIQSHMTDQAQWLLASEHPYAFDTDVTELRAERWCTSVSRSLYEQSTAEAEFAPELAASIADGALALACNGRIDYRLRGVWVRQHAEWWDLEPPGGGDLHRARLRGTCSDIVIEQGPDTGPAPVMRIEPHAEHVEAALDRALNRWQGEFPGISLERSDAGLRLNIPDALRTGHETHFAMVLERFLDYLDAGQWPTDLPHEIRMRYTLLAHAHQGAIDRDQAPI